MNTQKKVAQIRKEFPDFRSPQELNITDEEYVALNDVRIGLCNGTYAHHNSMRAKLAKMGVTPAVSGFNMGQWLDKKASCGTIGCIGGWMGVALNRPYRNAHSKSLNPLFYPYERGDGGAWEDITPKEASMACANFLKGNVFYPWSLGK